MKSTGVNFSAKHQEPTAKEDPLDIAATREGLQGMREKLVHEIKERLFSQNLKAPSEIGDWADLADDERAREFSLLLTNREREKLRAIDASLEKLGDGTYGICEECGENIEPGRLRVMPLAKYCVSCQSKLEKESRFPRREEDVRYNDLAFPEEEDEE